MKPIALVTYRNNPKLNTSDSLLPAEFAKHNTQVVPAAWDDPSVNWSAYSHVILRSCWNYHTNFESFRAWLTRLHTRETQIWNPYEIVLWNTRKSYLFDLATKGVVIVPSVLIGSPTSATLKRVAEKNGWNECIIKPVIGASAFHIIKINVKDFERSQSLSDILRYGDIILQPFMEDVAKVGEYSFVFFNKQYSHAVIKKPKSHEFRSQPEFGGTERPVTVPNAIIAQATHILNTVPSPLLYARVDGIVQSGIFYLMELELTEPYLFFEYEPSAPKKFVDAFLSLNT